MVVSAQKNRLRETKRQTDRQTDRERERERERERDGGLIYSVLTIGGMFRKTI